MHEAERELANHLFRSVPVLPDRQLTRSTLVGTTSRGTWWPDKGILGRMVGWSSTYHPINIPSCITQYSNNSWPYSTPPLIAHCQFWSDFEVDLNLHVRPLSISIFIFCHRSHGYYSYQPTTSTPTSLDFALRAKKHRDTALTRT